MIARIRGIGRSAGRGAVSPLVRRRLAELPPATPAVRFVSVYRQRNEASCRRLVDAAVALGWSVRLWALDTPIASLAEITTGHGPTARFAALRALAADAVADGAEWVLASDDDVALPADALGTLVSLCGAAGLAAGQPAHDPHGFPSHEFTLARPLSLVRDSQFIETGPTICVRRDWWDRFTEPCAGMGMGWGAELVWSDLRSAGARLGIVDAVPVRHLVPPGRSYDQEPERRRLSGMLHARGLASLEALHVTVATWRPWQPHPPWRAAP